MTYVRTSLRREKRLMREQMHGAGLEFRQIAVEFARLYRLRPRPAWREAHGWSLQDAADRINAFKGTTGLDPGALSGMTAPHLSEYENWPGHRDIPARRKPTPHLLAVLAAIYDCTVRDLLDLADRQHLPARDLLILDTCTRHPHPAMLPAEANADTRQQAGNPQAPGPSYVVLALPPGTQTIMIDVSADDDGGHDTAPQPARLLHLVNGPGTPA